VNGVNKEVNYTARVKCTPCEGTGSKPGTKPIPCKACKGRGHSSQVQGPFQFQAPCRTCSGKGTIIAFPCSTCRVEGVEGKRRTTTVHVPSGADTGMVVKVQNEGHQKPNGKSGNLLLQLQVEPHPVFQRVDNNIHVYVPISISQALIGDFVRVPTLTGEVEVAVPAGAQTGETRVLRGKGIKSIGKSALGNLYVHFDVQIPKKLTQRQIELMNEFKKDEPPVPQPASQPTSTFYRDHVQHKTEPQQSSNQQSSNQLSRVNYPRVK